MEKNSSKSPVARVESKHEVKGSKKTVPIVAEESDSESVWKIIHLLMPNY